MSMCLPSFRANPANWGSWETLPTPKPKRCPVIEPLVELAFNSLMWAPVRAVIGLVRSDRA